MPRWQRGLTGVGIMVVITPLTWLVSSLIEGTPFPPTWSDEALRGLIIGGGIALLALAGLELTIRGLKK